VAGPHHGFPLWQPGVPPDGFVQTHANTSPSTDRSSSAKYSETSACELSLEASRAPFLSFNAE
jgi:hypothetical protein